MKICTVNFDSEWLNIEKNLSKMEADILSILKTQKDVDTIVFPELNTSGYVTEDSLKSVAEKKNDQLILSIKRLSKKHDINLIGGFIEKDKGNFYNSAFVINKKGELVAVYRKNHMFTQSAEPEFYMPGNEIIIFELDGIKCGMFICFDIRYPRLFEAYKKQGVELMFGIYAWPKGRSKKEIFKFLVKARGHENQFFVTAVNHSGKDKNAIYESDHLSVNPLGEEIGESQGNYNFVEINKSLVKEVEEFLPLKDGWKENYEYNK